MNTAYDICSNQSHFHPFFEQANQVFDNIKDHISAPEALGATHDLVEEHLLAQGRELMRLLYQAHLDIRSLARPEALPVGDDGICRTHQRDNTSRQLNTLLGQVTLTRSRYSLPWHKTIIPLEAELNLPNDKFSLPMRKRCAELASKLSFDQCHKMLHDHSGLHVPKRQLQILARKAAVDFEHFYQETLLEVPAHETGELMIQTYDQKGIVMIPKALRAQSRKAAQMAKPKLDKRQSKGEKRHRKRLACVAAVYTLAGRSRTPADIIAPLHPVNAGHKPRPRPENKRVWAQVDKGAEQVIRDGFLEAKGRDPHGTKRWVVLVDGQPSQLKRIKAAAAELKQSVTIVLDIIHVLEWLWKAAYVFEKEASKPAQDWVTDKLEAILGGDVAKVVKEIRQGKSREGLSSKTLDNKRKCANYLENNAGLMKYDEYLRDGLPIGTGVIEGACRHLICDRMDITGARWGLESAEAVLKLRSLSSSGDWEDYWQFHCEQEHQRNHESHYLNGEIPTMRNPLLGQHLRIIK